MDSDVLLTVDPEGEAWATGPILSGEPRCERGSVSWGRSGRALAAVDSPHRESVDEVPCLFAGRSTRNLLPASFASFAEVPESWQGTAGLALEPTDQHFGPASLRLTGREPTTLTLPPIGVDPQEETAVPSTGYLAVLYQFSVHARGEGSLTLELRNLDRPEETTATEFPITSTWQRRCIALDGVFGPRNLEASVTVDGPNADLDGLMLEPYVTTYRSVDRAKLVPHAGAWVPGGAKRDRDRLELPISKGAVPSSGMIDFWFCPTWDALHPQHTFFQMCHGYFGFEVRSQEPTFFAGRKACAWSYYWEWAVAEGYEAGTWHHYALTWSEHGGATVYLDGQSRAHVEQVPAHAFDPSRAAEALIVGGSADGTMSFDPNVAGELDAYLAAWRLRAGAFDATAVLAAKEESDPRDPSVGIPPKAVFLDPEPRHCIARAKDHCWFVHNLDGTQDHLYTTVGRGDDHHPGPNLRLNTSDKPSEMESVDGGRTWQPGTCRHKAEPGILPDGRQLHFYWLIDGDPPCARMALEEADGRSTEMSAEFDMSALDRWQPNTLLCAHKVLMLRDGTYLLFASGSYPGVEGSAVGSSVFVFRSADLRAWEALACPYRPNGVQDHFNETSAVQLPSGRIVILMRTGGWNMILAKGISDDGGLTWSPPLRSGLRGIQPRMRTLQDGSILLVTGRPGIIMAVSSDEGETFSTIACAEDDRIHEFSSEFGWYGYSCMNNGVAVDESAGKAFISYDLLDERAEADGMLLNACFIRPYDLVRIDDYEQAVRERICPGDGAVRSEGEWITVPDRVSVTNRTGAALIGSFEGTGLVALLDTSTHAGAARIEIDGVDERAIPLYLPYSRTQRVLLARGLSPGRHTFRVALEEGYDPEHKFANPEMPMLGGEQTIHMAGTTPERRLAIYGFEVLA